MKFSCIKSIITNTTVQYHKRGMVYTAKDKITEVPLPGIV